jgi:hypothetical protein
MAPSVTAWAQTRFPELRADRPYNQPGNDPELLRRSGRGFAPVCVCPGKYRTRREDRPAHLIGATTEASDWYVAAQANNLEPVDDLVTSDRAPL